jgi:hypothetical protein
MIDDRPISETRNAQAKSYRRRPVDFDPSKKAIFPYEPEKSLKIQGRQLGQPQRCPVFFAQRSAAPARQMIVSRRADKYRVRCAQ